MRIFNKSFKNIFLFILFCQFASAVGTNKNLEDPSYNANNVITSYFKSYEHLFKLEKWEEIIRLGKIAKNAALNAGRPQDEAKICAQLTSISYYLGDYAEALTYAKRSRNLSEDFEDCTFYLKALYLESAVYRALASKNYKEKIQQTYFLNAVNLAEDAAFIYSQKDLDDDYLQGKIYFNLGAAHADNPKGNLKKATDHYNIALECFKRFNSTSDVIRTNLRLGKIYLLQKNYYLTKKIIDEIRPQILSERISMQTDYLESKLKLALKDFKSAAIIAKNGLNRAKALKAKDDLKRFKTLLKSIQSSL